MRVNSLIMHSFRSFQDPQHISLSDINVFIGHNNAGKSSVIRALHQLQSGSGSSIPDIRADAHSASIHIELSDLNPNQQERLSNPTNTCNISFNIRRDEKSTTQIDQSVASNKNFQPFPNIDPDHVIVPFFSKRKSTHFSEDVKIDDTKRINTDNSNLAAKLSIVGNPSFSQHKAYTEACMDILGFLVTSTTSAHGQRPGTYLPNNSILSIDQMGEGVPQIVSLLADLATSEGKIFLIEEPENDLHPTALKSLLDLIIQSSGKNQFVITTHSNIVVRHLCAEQSSKLFEVRAESRKLPIISSIKEVEKNSDARMAVLKDLGYTLSDFDLWEGWLILEESSAERIIRDYLIPWYAPKLSCLRTMAVNGITNIEPSFNDFQRLICYAHLENAYRETTWVLVDGDTPGKDTIDRLQKKYKTWDSNRFSYFENEQFENYYPSEFSNEISIVLAEKDKQKRREEKKNLLHKVIAWLNEDKDRGEKALRTSATEVISKLKKIEETLFPAKSNNLV